MKELDEILEKYKDVKTPLIPILEDVQDKYGYLSYDNLLYISEHLKMSLEEVYSVVTFYKHFKLNARGKYQISLCLGTVCYVKGSKDLLDELESILGIKTGECTKDFKFSIDTTRCLGCCGMAPVIMINDDVYGNVKRSEIKNILSKYN